MKAGGAEAEVGLEGGLVIAATVRVGVVFGGADVGESTTTRGELVGAAAGAVGVGSGAGVAGARQPLSASASKQNAIQERLRFMPIIVAPPSSAYWRHTRACPSSPHGCTTYSGV